MKRSFFKSKANQPQRSRLSRRQGFVLMLVLALIVFGVTLLARFSQQSVGLASQAHRREREIQNRWAAWSLASTCVKSSDRLLDRAGNTTKKPRQNFLNTQVTLAGQAWQIRINDLDTSINLNTINRLSKSTAVTRLLNSVSVSGAQSIINRRQTSERFDSWGQLWDVARLTPSQLADVQQSCTCWSSGKLNLRFTTDKVLNQLGRALGRTGLFNRVIRERANTEDVQLKSIIQEAAISPKDTKLLSATLSDRSASFSVIVWNVQSGDPALQCILESGSGNYADRHSTFRYEHQSTKP